jgi:hypothetical protein
MNHFCKRKNNGKRLILLLLSLFRMILIRSLRVTEWTLPKYSESHGMSTLFGITKTVPGVFRRIFSEQNFDGNPNSHSKLISHIKLISLRYSTGWVISYCLGWIGVHFLKMSQNRDVSFIRRFYSQLDFFISSAHWGVCQSPRFQEKLERVEVIAKNDNKTWRRKYRW